MASKRIHVFYSGRVQGVGFRFATEVAARRLKLSGWASNLKDGRVEVVAEGEEAALKDFLAGITEEMSHYIVNADVSWEHPSGEFKSFGIKFSE
ncbi:MAG: acylphosphatase [Candidatus Omnitrophota bacterium]|jgi:acylphosphatase